MEETLTALLLTKRMLKARRIRSKGVERKWEVLTVGFSS